MPNGIARKIGLFLCGVILGTAAILAFAWGWLPVAVYGDPANLNADSKEAYILLTSMAYQADGDLARARARLAQLNDPDMPNTLRRMAERAITTLQPEEQRRSLAKLALALGADSVTLRVYAVSPTPTQTRPPTPTLQATPTLLATALLATIAARTPTRTATPTVTPLPRVSFRLFEQVRVTCAEDKSPKPHLIIFVQDATGRGMPGVQVRVQWSDGQDVFFTGLRGGDPGYADFEVQPNKMYSVVVVDGTSQVASALDSNVLSPDCPGDGKTSFRAWRVIFRRVG